MLNEWEKQRLYEIEHDLASDPSFMRAIEDPTKRWRRTIGVNSAWYPAALLTVALASMSLAVGRSLVPRLAALGATLVLVFGCAWVRATWGKHGHRPPRPRQ